MSGTKWQWIVLFAALSATGCKRRGSSEQSSTAETALRELTVPDLAARIARHDTVTVIDNNSRARYEEGHIPGARWVQFDHVAATDLPADHASALVFYCHSET
jgi:3-mercaptopyruvate sulfurtransferase SseA